MKNERIRTFTAGTKQWIGECFRRAINHDCIPVRISETGRHMVNLLFGLDGKGGFGEDPKTPEEVAKIVSLPVEVVREFELEVAAWGRNFGQNL